MNPILPAILGAFSLVGLLVGKYSGAEPAALLALKSGASIMFVLAALLVPRPEPGYFRLVLIGLLFGLGGDVLLELKGQAFFLAGLVGFLLGHVFYAVAFFRSIPVRRPLPPGQVPDAIRELDRTGTYLAGLVASLFGLIFQALAFFRSIPVRRPLPPGQVPDAIRELDRTGTYLAGLVASLFGLIFQALAFFRSIPARSWLTPWQIPVVLAALAVAYRILPRAGEMLLPVILYIAIITVMVCGAVAVWRAGGRTRGFGTLVVLGSVLFFFSDYLVACNNFVERSFLNSLLLLPAYYAAQFMFAWSVGRAGKVPDC